MLNRFNTLPAPASGAWRAASAGRAKRRSCRRAPARPQLLGHRLGLRLDGSGRLNRFSSRGILVDTRQDVAHCHLGNIQLLRDLLLRLPFSAHLGDQPVPLGDHLIAHGGGQFVGERPAPPQKLAHNGADLALASADDLVPIHAG